MKETAYAHSKRKANPKHPAATTLRKLRSDWGLSQRQLAFGAKFSQGYLSMIERGLVKPRYNTVTPLIRFFRKLGADVTHADFGL